MARAVRWRPSGQQPEEQKVNEMRLQWKKRVVGEGGQHLDLPGPEGFLGFSQHGPLLTRMVGHPSGGGAHEQNWGDLGGKIDGVW
jgi:hypothetical protein